MLTSELLRIRRRNGRIEPRYLRGAVRRRLGPVAAALVDALKRSAGASRAAVREALDAVDHRASDRPVVAGLRKLLLDRCMFEVTPGPEPALVRQQVFVEAARRRRALAPGERFDREEILQAACAALELSPALVAERLHADLRDRERLDTIRPIDPRSLLERYDVALAQGVLLRATEVRVELQDQTPATVRQLFREARFRGLIHQITDRGEGGYQLKLDGPFSLFSAVQKYGLALALLLPAVLRCRRWRLSASLLWGRGREPLGFELGPEQGLVAHGRQPSGVAPEIDSFVRRFRKLDSPWKIARARRIVSLPGEPVCVPDLVFTHAATGERVYLEAFGFWSRQAVWQRIESLARGLPVKLILAVGKQLRVSEAALEESEAACLYVYRASMRPQAILDKLEAQRSGE